MNLPAGNLCQTDVLVSGSIPGVEVCIVIRNSRRNPMAVPKNQAELTAKSAPQVDEDASLVSRVQSGDTDAFEGLVRRHQGRVYRTLIGITGNREDAEDSTQNTFLKAFRHIGEFQAAAKFSTWLTRIAINEGLQQLRKRKSMESLDEPETDSDQGFRPRQVQAWEDSPEQAYSKAEMRELVEGELMKLPLKYRVVIMLRDLEELSTEEAVAALGLTAPALKTRLLRGRLMLREALAPRFMRKRREGSRA